MLLNINTLGFLLNFLKRTMTECTLPIGWHLNRVLTRASVHIFLSYIFHSVIPLKFAKVWLDFFVKCDWNKDVFTVLPGTKSRIQVMANRSIKAQKLERQLQYPVRVKSQGMAETPHAFHFYQNSGGGLGRKSTCTHTQALRQPWLGICAPELLALGQQACEHSCFSFSRHGDTGTHRETLTDHKTKSCGNELEEWPFCFSSKHWREWQEITKAVWQKKNDPPTISAQSPPVK